MKNNIFKIILCCFVKLYFCVNLIANDFTDFSTNEGGRMLNVQSTAEAMTDVNIEKSIKKQKPVTQNQISLLKQTNKKRNGIYIMLTIDMIPLQRLITPNDSINGLSFGGGIRGGVVSYLDDYIGIRGYFALDFTSDSLSPFERQRENQKGNFLMLSLGMDILIDFFIDKNYKNTIGFFMGIGAGGLMYFDLEKPMIQSGNITNAPVVILTGNIMVQGGISSIISYKHRIELGARFLPTQSFLLSSDGILADYNFYVGYSYKF